MTTAIANSGLLNFVKQADGNYAVRRGYGPSSIFLGIVGRDAGGRWWASYQGKSRGPNTLCTAMLYVNGLRTRDKAVEELLIVHGLVEGATQP